MPGVQIGRHRVGQRVCIHIFFVGIEFSRKSLWQVPSGDPCLGCVSQLLLHLFFYQVPLSLQFSHLISNISKSFYHDSRINHLGLKRIHHWATSLCKLRASLRSNSGNEGLHFLNELHLISFVGLSHVLHFVVLDLLLVHNFHNHSSVFIKHLLLHYLRVGWLAAVRIGHLVHKVDHLILLLLDHHGLLLLEKILLVQKTKWNCRVRVRLVHLVPHVVEETSHCSVVYGLHVGLFSCFHLLGRRNRRLRHEALRLYRFLVRVTQDLRSGLDRCISI